MLITDSGHAMVAFTRFPFCVFLLVGLHLFMSFALVTPLFNV